jgi:uncharacterized oxidoreductase
MRSTDSIRFRGKTVVITGGTSGIGYQMVRRLSPNNTVLVIARPGLRMDALRSEFPSIETYPADLSKPEQYEAIAHQLLTSHPNIDVLINNAAVQHTTSFLADGFFYESIAREINLNFTSVCSLSYLLLPALLSDHHTAVIANINSGLGLVPKTSSAVYCATKGAMNIFSQSLGYQLENSNIRVMQAILPLVDTAMTEGRGRGKISAEAAAKDIVVGIESGLKIHYIGKTQWIRLLMMIAPPLIRKLMKRS